MKIKYPRTFHLPWSKTISNDDKILKNLDHFLDQEVVVTLKLDGENTTLGRDYSHARSLDGSPHPSRDWLKNFHATFSHEIPKGFRVCGENLYAKHSIHYSNLKSYLYVFSIWNDKNEALSWDETIEWCSLLGLCHVPVLYRGLWDEGVIKSLYKESFQGNQMEGYVVRLARSFHYDDFNKSIAKMVREHHVQTLEHWKHQEIIPNKLQS